MAESRPSSRQDPSPGSSNGALGAWSDESFRRLVDTVHDYAIFLLDVEGRIRSWDQGAERLKGYTAPEAIGKHFHGRCGACTVLVRGRRVRDLPITLDKLLQLAENSTIRSGESATGAPPKG